MAKKSARPCTVCRSKHLHQIEVGLTNGISCPALAQKFGLSKDSIYRHQKSHLTPQMRAAILSAQKPSEIDLDALRASETEGLLSQLVVQRARLQSHVEMAAQYGDIRAAVAAEGAITGNLQLVAKLLGQLVNVHDVRHTSLLISPDYLKLRAALVDALRPFPEAARAVSAALHRLESDAAKDITSAAQKPKPAPAVIEHVPQPVKLPPPPC